MGAEKFILIVIIYALITFGLRARPFLLFHNYKKIPEKILKHGQMLPSSIMAVLIVYCLKDTANNLISDGIWKIAAVVIVAVTFKWKHNTLASIIIGTVCYMGFIRLAAVI